MKYCSNCGCSIEANQKFCPNCGNSISSLWSASQTGKTTNDLEINDIPQADVAVKRRHSALGIICFILSFTLFLSPIGVILAILDLIVCKHRKHGLSIAALVIGGILSSLLVIGFLFPASSTSSSVYATSSDPQTADLAIKENNEAEKVTQKPTSTPSSDSTDTIQNGDGLLIASDEYVSIRFIGCELSDKFYGKKYNVCFIVENKTHKEITVRTDTLAINGWALSDAFISKEIPPHCKSIIKVPSDELQDLQASAISGTMTIADFSQELWGTLARDYTFDETIK